MQPSRQNLREDIAYSIRTAVAGGHLVKGTGRIWLATEQEVGAILATVDGIESFSRCRMCRPADLDREVVAFAGQRLDPGQSFRVRVSQAGEHSERSPDLAARLGAAILEALPGLRVDLEQPDRTIGVETRWGECFLFDHITDGLGRDRESVCNAHPDRFLVDQMLGPLARWLRLLGFDTSFLRDVPDSALIRAARSEARVLVTRDRALAERGGAAIVYVRSQSTDDQLRELIEHCALDLDIGRLFSRCTVCNHPVESVDKRSVADAVPPAAYRENDHFTRCRSCRRVYWAGTHYQRIIERVRAIAPSDFGTA